MNCFKHKCNILRYCIFDFHALIIKIKKNLKCFTLHVMNLEYMKVSLFGISYKKNRYSNFYRCMGVGVGGCVGVGGWVGDIFY